MYSFSFSERSNDFDEYYLEVQNNAIHSYGADYAIDGLRIYRSIPKIDVKRVDVCSSASLTVATDYELLLKNMGWSINPDVLSDLNMGYTLLSGTDHHLFFGHARLCLHPKLLAQLHHIRNH